MALKQQGQQKARVSGHLDWPDLPTLFPERSYSAFGPPPISEAQKQELLAAWYEQVKQAVLTKFDELASKVEEVSAVTSTVDTLTERVKALEAPGE